MVFNIFKKGDAGETSDKGAGAEGLADMLRYIVIRLVDNPDDVVVKEVEGDRATVLEVKVNQEDMGKVIGKKGRIIKSLRVVMRAAAISRGKTVSIELVD